MSVLELPNQGAGAFVDEVPRSIYARNAAGTGVVGEGLTRAQQDAGVVDAESETMIILQLFLPVVPGLAVIRQLIFNGVRSAKPRAVGLLCVDTRCNYRQQ